MFKDNLKALRKSAGLSQSQLADMLNVSYKTVSHWESGYSEPSIGQLAELKRIFGVDYEELLDK